MVYRLRTSRTDGWLPGSTIARKSGLSTFATMWYEDSRGYRSSRLDKNVEDNLGGTTGALMAFVPCR